MASDRRYPACYDKDSLWMITREKGGERREKKEFHGEGRRGQVTPVNPRQEELSMSIGKKTENRRNEDGALPAKEWIYPD